MKRFHFSLNANRKVLAIAAVFGSAAFWTVTKVWAFNPQPDPPAFAAIQMLTSETAKLYATCSADSPFGVNPGPCDVLLAFRDQTGATIRQATLSLRPGQTGHLDLPAVEVATDGLMLIVPSVRPSMGGRILPAVQITDRTTNKTTLYAGPISPRLSFFGM